MCTFMKTSDLQVHKKWDPNSKSADSNQFIDMYLKPNKEGENYRFRLLYFTQPLKNDRKDPFIEQWIHEHWGTTEKGLKIVDDYVVCPKTSYSHYDEEKRVIDEAQTSYNSDGSVKKRFMKANCPICEKANKYWGIYRASGKTDKAAVKMAMSLMPKFRAYVPVYVIHDPNVTKQDLESPNGIKYVNDGRIKCLVFTDKSEYDKLTAILEEEKTKAYLASQNGTPYEVFNGTNAVDLYIHVDTVTEISNEGTSKEYKRDVRKITKIAFGKKPSNIDAINKDNIDKFTFDDKHYISHMKGEIAAFYNKYYDAGSSNVPTEEVDVFGNDDTPKSDNTVVSVKNETATNETELTTDDIMNEIEDVDTVSDVVNSENNNVSSESENKKSVGESQTVDDILADLDF